MPIPERFLIMKWSDTESNGVEQSWWDTYYSEIADAFRNLSGGLYPAVMISRHGLRYFTEQEFSELWRSYWQKDAADKIRQRLQQRDTAKVARLVQPHDN